MTCQMKRRQLDQISAFYPGSTLSTDYEHAGNSTSYIFQPLLKQRFKKALGIQHGWKKFAYEMYKHLINVINKLNWGMHD